MIDTTYWGRNFGVVVFKDAISKKFIWWYFITRKEKIEDYELGFKWCLEHGYIIKGVVSDGFRGLVKIIAPVPFQICQVHIQRAVQTKLTKKPKSTAAAELLALSKKLTELSKREFEQIFGSWQEKHKDFINEISVDDNGKARHTHYRLYSAGRTFKDNLGFLFTFESVKNLPKTNNGLEGEFAHLKTKLRVHNGLKFTNRKKFISHYFALKNKER